MTSITDWNAHSLFAAMTDLLPQMAEEGTLQQTCHVTAIERGVMDALACPAGEAQHLRLIVERVLTALGVLDQAALVQGVWQFVSFPPAYWEQGPHRPPTMIEEQRALLQTLENRRLRYGSTAVAPLPIRVVHVAWGVIRLDGRFALLHREDRARPGLGITCCPADAFSRRIGPDFRRLICRIRNSLANACRKRYWRGNWKRN